MLRTALTIAILALLSTTSWAQDASKAGSFITSAEADTITRNRGHQVDGVRSHVYSKEPFFALLAQDGVEGIRFFPARREGAPTLVAAGAGADGRRLPAGSILVDDAYFCPPWCSGTLAPPQDISRAGAIVSDAQAADLTEGFTLSIRGVRSFLYSADLFRQLLAQPGAEGLRVHYGTRRDHKERRRAALVFEATDIQGNPLPDGLLLDDSQDCPPDCPSGG